MKKNLSLVVVFVLFLSTIFNSVVFAATDSTVKNGFHISGTTLYDANGSPFVMRGVNHAFCWYMGKETTAIPAIADTGANCVRIVLADGQQWTKTTLAQLQNLIRLCEANKLVAIVEIHDATGSDSTSYLDNAVNYWIEMKSALIGHENTVIINIANEWYGTWDSAGWAAGYTANIPKLRDAGIKNTFIVDCAGWGQYPKSIVDSGKTVAAADPLKNTMFAIHMYEYAGKDAATVKSNIDNALAIGYPVCIEEFGIKHTNGDVDDATIMSYSTEKNVGYLGWSWKGNSTDLAYLDMVNDWSGTSLTEQGQAIINGTYGIKATSQICTVYTIKDVEAPTVPTNLTSTEKSATTVDLSWTASSDDVKVTGYDIYNGTTLVGSSTTNSYTVTGLTSNTTYSFTVKAKDASGKISAASNAVSVKTDVSDTIEPTVPTNLTSTGKSATTVDLSWTAATDNVKVTGYDIYNGSTLIGSSTTNSYTVTGLSANTIYSFTVKAKDASNNASPASTALSVTTEPMPIAGNIKVKYMCDNTSASSNSIKPNFQIYNTGTTTINLSDIKVRYYYTDDLKKSQNASAYWASSGISTLTNKIVKMETPKTSADSYDEFGFTSGAGTLAPGKCVEIHGVLNYTDWANYTQTNDYSFNGFATSYIDNTKFTGYINNNLAWGNEPLN